MTWLIPAILFGLILGALVVSLEEATMETEDRTSSDKSIQGILKKMKIFIKKKKNENITIQKIFSNLPYFKKYFFFKIPLIRSELVSYVINYELPL